MSPIIANMPIIKSAKKKLRQDVGRTKRNKKTALTLKISRKKALKTTTPTSLSEAFSAIDTAFKKRVIHKNKAARLKSQLASKLKKKN